MSEWIDWHRQYTPGSPLSRRLDLVRDFLKQALDAAPEGRIRVVSMCAGDGRDLLGVLPHHPRGRDVIARLVELDASLAAAAEERARREGLRDIEVVCGDAGGSDAYEGAVPAGIVMVCGVFGNITDSDVRTTVGRLPELCAPAASVIWTRGTFAPDLTPQIRSWFARAGFDEQRFVAIPGTSASVGLHRLVTQPRQLQRGAHLFSFLAAEQRPSRRPPGS